MVTIEDLITKLKSIEVSAHIWKWDTVNASEIDAIKKLYKEIHLELDRLITRTIGSVGFKIGGFQLTEFDYYSLDDLDMEAITKDLKDYLYEKVKNPQNPFPEVESCIINIIGSLSEFRYKMMLE